MIGILAQLVGRMLWGAEAAALLPDVIVSTARLLVKSRTAEGVDRRARSLAPVRRARKL